MAVAALGAAGCWDDIIEPLAAVRRNVAGLRRGLADPAEDSVVGCWAAGWRALPATLTELAAAARPGGS